MNYLYVLVYQMATVTACLFFSLAHNWFNYESGMPALHPYISIPLGLFLLAFPLIWELFEDMHMNSRINSAEWSQTEQDGNNTAMDEHELLGCPLAKTGIYTPIVPQVFEPCNAFNVEEIVNDVVEPYVR